MPIKDPEAARQWRRAHKRKLRAKEREARIELGNLRDRMPLHQRLGIETHVHRQAILNHPNEHKYDQITRSWSQQHPYRESVTLAGAPA